jgi:transcriptional regulator with XRE-family HTH domain
MHTIQFIRQKLAISFAQLANYLALPISQLSMAQSGRRKLPDAANLLLIRLQHAITQSELKLSSLCKKPTGLEIAQLNRVMLDKIQNTTLQLAATHKNLAIAQTKYRQGQLFLQVAAYLQDHPADNRSLNREELWLNALTGNANDLIIDNSYANRMLLELQIKVLEFTLAETKKMQLS